MLRRPLELRLGTAEPAIHGGLSDPSGNGDGVAGVDNSPDGAGVAVANAHPGGGPDPRLNGGPQGVADWTLTESALLRDCGAAVGFAFSNPGDPFSSTIQGVPMVTTPPPTRFCARRRRAKSTTI